MCFLSYFRVAVQWIPLQSYSLSPGSGCQRFSQHSGSYSPREVIHFAYTSRENTSRNCHQTRVPWFGSQIAYLTDFTYYHRQIHNKPDHLPSLVVEAGLEQVWPFCCWYTPPTFHTHFNRILCAVNMFIGVLFKEKYHLYTNNAQD